MDASLRPREGQKMIQDMEFQFLLDKIQKAKSLDFTLYRSGTLRRRIQSRLRATGCSNYADYLVYLNRNGGEYDLLLDALTINVTEFFRDTAVFECLEKNVIPVIVNSSSERKEDLLGAYKAGGMIFMKKNNDPKSLELVIQQMKVMGFLKK